MNRLTEHQRDAHLKMRVVPAAVRDTHTTHIKRQLTGYQRNKKSNVFGESNVSCCNICIST